VGLNLSEEVETGASNIPNDVLTEMSVDAPVEPLVEGSPLVEEIQPPSNDPLPTTTNAAIEFDPTEIVVDPGLRKPIEEYDINIRDIVRREYLLRGLCQPIGHVYPKKIQSGRQRSFLESWFKKYPWLEYSVSRRAAFCFYCYLFKQPRRGDNFGGDAFTTRGFVIGKMQHKYLENMWVKLIACIIALDNIVRILETKGKVWTM